MAKLQTYHVLCPLIDQNSFLGVSEDKEESCLIVTLSRNVVNRYRKPTIDKLTDQKQVGGWTSKDHISSSVIYDKTEDNYAGVFNNNVIKIWKEDGGTLDKIKKHKFSMPIHKILPHGDKMPVVVLKNGVCASLPYAIEHKKSMGKSSLLKEGDTITESALLNLQGQDYICYIVQGKRSGLEIVLCLLSNEICEVIPGKLKHYKIDRPEFGIEVAGKVICSSDTPTVYVLWTDGKMFSFDLTKCTWRCISTVPWISTEASVSMQWMGDDHLAIFGFDSSNDGAIITTYNVILGVGSCRYPLKMYCEGAKLYCYFNRLIVEAGNHIGYLSYAIDTSRSLSSLIATHEITEEDSVELVDWGVGEAPAFVGEIEYENLLKRGMSEREICVQYIPDLLEKRNHEDVLKILKEFEDIPENIVVSLLQYAISLFKYDSETLKSKEKLEKLCEDTRKKDFLNYIFGIHVSDSNIIPFLRNNLQLNDVLFLLTYISYLLEDDKETNLFDVHFERKLIDWSVLLMDGFYQQYLVSKNEDITTVLHNLQGVTNTLINELEDIDNVLGLLYSLNSNKVDKSSEASYLIEEIKLY